MSDETAVPEPDDLGDEDGVPTELIDLHIAMEEGATVEQLIELAEAGLGEGAFGG